MRKSQTIVNADDELWKDRTVLMPGDAAAAIIVNAKGEYLLQLRDRKRGIFFPGLWGCFGGAIESGDTSVEAALRRELGEELGLVVTPRQLRKFTHYTFDMSFCGAGTISVASSNWS